MYVCICNAVTSRQISDAIEDGASSFKALRDCLGVATNCGQCGDAVRRQLRQTSAGTRPGHPSEPASASAG